jgi:hypothetical protein
MAPRRTKGKPPTPVSAGSSHAGARPATMLKAKLLLEIALFFNVFSKFSLGLRSCCNAAPGSASPT